jgi:hypothetical protein
MDCFVADAPRNDGQCNTRDKKKARFKRAFEKE